MKKSAVFYIGIVFCLQLTTIPNIAEAKSCRKSTRLIKRYHELIKHDFYLSNHVSSRLGIRGSDDRKILFDTDSSNQLNSIGQLSSKLFGNRIGGGTATLISGKYILGVAHSFLPPSRYESIPTKPGKVYFTPARIFNNCPFGVQKIKRVFFRKEWLKGEHDNWDIAVAELENDLEIPTPGLQAYEYSLTSLPEVLETVGYPHDQKEIGTRISTNGRIVPLFSSEERKKGYVDYKKVWNSVIGDERNILFHSLDGAAGQSGSPIFNANTGRIIGVYTKSIGTSTPERNQGVALTPVLFNWVNDILDGTVNEETTVIINY